MDAAVSPHERDRVAIALAGLAVPPLAPLDLVVPAGGVVALLGRNGIGKSTLLRCVAGLSAPAGGLATVRGAIGWAPQDYRASLFPWLSIDDNAGLLLAGSGLSVGERRRRARAALAAVGFPAALSSRRVHQLSGGELQRIVLARALAATPGVLLLDEPCSALDLAGRVTVRRAIAELVAAHRAAVVIATHDLDDVLALADRALVLGGTPTRVVADLRVAGDSLALRARLLDACTEAV